MDNHNDNHNDNIDNETIDINIDNETIPKISVRNKFFTIPELIFIKSTGFALFKKFVNNNILSLCNISFEEELTNYLYNNTKQIVLDKLVATRTKSTYINVNSIQQKIQKKLNKILKIVIKYSWTKVIPYRSYTNSFIRNIKCNLDKLNNKISYLENIYQPQQKTEEWYQFRHNLLTASSIWKILSTQANINSIIYEKCKPFTLFKNASMDSPLHWGQKYEPASIQLYEHLYNTKIGDFGCIQHPKYPFIGASPDGININPTNNRYARMLEIKNVVSRVINGIPKMEYWIQMQVQMETCDLNECDFLETQFLEYHNYEDFISDGTFTITEDNKQKGIILLFNRNGNSFYEYAPININEEQYHIWEADMFNKHNTCEWIRTIYWKLEKLSNILVLRNKLWFEKALPKFQFVWETIIKEKITGYEHRAPKTKPKIKNFMPNKCLILIEKL